MTENTTTVELVIEAARKAWPVAGPGADPHINALTALLEETYAEIEALRARVAGWERDAQHPEFVPEEVTDAAFRSQESWWHPDRDSGVQSVVVPRMIEQVAEAAYRATLATIEAQR